MLNPVTAESYLSWVVAQGCLRHHKHYCQIVVSCVLLVCVTTSRICHFCTVVSIVHQFSNGKRKAFLQSAGRTLLIFTTLRSIHYSSYLVEFQENSHVKVPLMLSSFIWGWIGNDDKRSSEAKLETVSTIKEGGFWRENKSWKIYMHAARPQAQKPTDSQKKHILSAPKKVSHLIPPSPQWGVSLSRNVLRIKWP